VGRDISQNGLPGWDFGEGVSHLQTRGPSGVL